MTDIQISILGIVIIFVTTALGSSLVYFFKNGISSKTNTIFLGFAGGVMVSASFFSLLLPAIEETTGFGSFQFVPATVGFLIGGLFLVLLDKVTPHFHKGTNSEEGPHFQVKKSVRLFLAVTLHNIPEGLAVGFALGSASSGSSGASILAALGLAIGIGVQNFAEGAALALPMSVTTKSRHKAFALGTLSGLVEPIFAIVGYFLASYIQSLQPWLLAFAAGAMIFVVIEDLIPDAKTEEHEHLGTWSAMLGFASMMILDVVL
ncbi:MAG: ZIP family metal transporter [Clostridia bacterium]|nr:ZIP family metal transporter [Clostridia bacterium]